MSGSADAFRVLLDSSRTRLCASVGVETLGGTFTPVLERGSSIPCQKTEVFSTAVDNQEAIDIHVLQGNAETVSDPAVSTIGKFSLKGISRARAGVPQIRVCFSVNFIGRFQLSARDVSTGRDIEVSGQSGISHLCVPQASPQAKTLTAEEAGEGMVGETVEEGGIDIPARIVRLDHAFYQIGDTTPGPVWMPRERGSYLPVKVTLLESVSVKLTQKKIDEVLKERASGMKAGILIAMGLPAFIMSMVCLHFIVDVAAYGKGIGFGVLAVALWGAVVKVALREVKYTSTPNPSPKQMKLAREAAMQAAAAARGMPYGWPQLSRNEEGEYNTPKSGLFESAQLDVELEGWVADKDGRTYRRKGYRDGDYA